MSASDKSFLFMFYFLLSVGAVEKFSSFGFAKRWLLYRAKPNVCNAGRQKEILKNAKG
jgi:hypothetical protein